MNSIFIIITTTSTSEAISTLPTYDKNLVSRILPNAVIFCLLIFTLWITISLIHYGFKTKKWKKLRKQTLDNKLSIGHIYTSVILCGSMNLLYNTVALVFINTGFATKSYIQDYYCDLLSDFIYSAYALAMFSTAIFLWLRQRMFFQNRLLNISYTKCVKTFSYLSLFLTLVVTVGVLTINVYPNDHKATEDGCVHNPSSNSSKTGYWVSVIIAIVLYQSIFLGLFIYALTNIRNSQKSKVSRNESRISWQRSLHNSETEMHKLKKLNSKNDLRATPKSFKRIDSSKLIKSKFDSRQSACATVVKATILRTFAVAVITMLLYVLAMILIGVIAKPLEHRRYSVMIASICLFFHFCTIVTSFAQRRKMMTSFCSHCKHEVDMDRNKENGTKGFKDFEKSTA